jgi:hypothetical protein
MCALQSVAEATARKPTFILVSHGTSVANSPITIKQAGTARLVIGTSAKIGRSLTRLKYPTPRLVFSSHGLDCLVYINADRKSCGLGGIRQLI